ncbi:MAG: hypothetical protein QOD57_713 [Actinomycetota bacterium]|jgi:formyl-CoA transferase/CoA:oxalate CoA-transferase|nr:hypothetical protein [Actinomycetota bacterium]
MDVAGTYSGLRVVELGSNIAGPLAAMILGDLGADVIKVEPPGTGDDTRSMAPMVGGESTVFRSFNRSKRSVALDLATEAGRRALGRLTASADVVIQNLRPGVADKLGAGFDAVRAANPTVIYCSISAFGEGPVGRTLPGYDALVQAASGIMASTGHPGEGGPVRVSASLADVSTGMWAAMGIMAALARRPHVDSAQYVDPTLLDSAFLLMAHQVNAYLALGEVPQRLGSGSPSFVPYRAYAARDGWVFVAAGSDRVFVKLCTVLGCQELAEDPRFGTIAARVANREALDRELEPRLALRPVGEWVEVLGRAGIPAGPVNDLGQALDTAVAGEREVLVRQETEKLPWLRLPVDRGRAAPYRPTPKLGEHTRPVLLEAGLTGEEIDALTAQGGEDDG